MRRREFLKLGLCAAASAMIAPPLKLLAQGITALDTNTTRLLSDPTLQLAVIKDGAPKELVDKAIYALGGMKRFVSKGDNVIVKPNIGWDRNPNQAANTHPEVVKELIKLCLDAGAGKVRVFDNTCNDPRRCYVNSGIKDAVESLDDSRVSIYLIDERKFVDVKIKDKLILGKWKFYKDALEADVFINVPVAKHHGLTRLTLGMKNIMGIIGGRRGSIHVDIDKKLPDLNQVVKSDLTVIDMTRVLIAHGPSGGNLDDVKVLNTVVASPSVVTADAQAAKIMGVPTATLQWLINGYKVGLGEMDLGKVKRVTHSLAAA